MNQNPNLPQPENIDPGAALAAIDAAEKVLQNSPDQPQSPYDESVDPATATLMEAGDAVGTGAVRGVASDMSEVASRYAARFNNKGVDPEVRREAHGTMRGDAVRASLGSSALGRLGRRPPGSQPR